MTVSFKGAVPAGVSDIVDASGLKVNVIENVGFSKRELDSFTSDALDSARQILGDSVATLVAAPDIDQRHIIVYVNSSDASVADRLQSRSVSGAVARSHTLDFPVEYSVSSDVVAEPEVSYDGGRNLAGVCTGAFSVQKNGTPMLGVLTAGHCLGTGSYSGVPDAFNPVVGMSLSTTGGDSGGPWFFGDTAYGIHFGRVAASGVNCSCWSSVPNALNRFGLSLWVG